MINFDFNEFKKNIDTYLEAWEEEPYKTQEEILQNLFTNNYPSKDSLDIVVCQVSVLNHFYNARVRNDDILPLAKYICGIGDFETRVKNGEIKLVEEISDSKNSADEKHRTHNNYYSFASKYCSFFNPDKYPIYDSKINEILYAFDQSQHFFDGKVLKDESKNYKKFVDEITKFSNALNLNEKYNYKKTDQCLWMYYKKKKKNV